MTHITRLPALIGFLLTLFCVSLNSVAAQDFPPAPHEADFPTAFDEAHTLTFIVDNLPDDYQGDQEVIITHYVLDDRNQVAVTELLPPNGRIDYQLPVPYPALGVEINFAEYGKWCWMDGDLTVRIDYQKDNTGSYPEQFSGPAAGLAEAYDEVFVNIDMRRFSYFLPMVRRWLQDDDYPIQERYERAVMVYDSLLMDHANYLQTTPPAFQTYWRQTLEQDFSTELAGFGIRYKGNLPPAMVQRIRTARPQIIDIATAGNYGTQQLYYAREAFLRMEMDTTSSDLDRSLTYARSAVRLLDERLPPAHADLLKLQLTNKDFRLHRTQLEVALPTVVTPWVREVMEERIDDLTEQIAALNAWLTQPAGNTSKTGFGQAVSTLPNGARLYIMNNSLTDTAFVQQLRTSFSGKAVYLDFWATWCGGCLLQFPASKQLHGDLKEEPLEFVYLCSDAGTDQEEWEKTVAKWELPGTHIFLPADRMESIMALFGFRGYPNYLLIRPDGSTIANDLYPADLTASQLQTAVSGK